MGQDGEVLCPSGVLLWGLARSLVSQGASIPPPLKLSVLAQPVVAPDIVFPQQPPVLPGLRVQLLQLLGGAHIHLEQPDGVRAGIRAAQQPSTTPGPQVPWAEAMPRHWQVWVPGL